jgi:hypothetical protein
MDVIYDISKLTPSGGGQTEYGFECPGCGMNHWFKTTGPSPVWSWNGDYKNPTITPSINVTFHTRKGPGRCHFFVRNGMIEFCGDSTHQNAGKTMRMIGVDE